MFDPEIFIDSLLVESGMTTSQTPEMLDQMRSDLMVRLNQYLGQAVYQAVPLDKRDTFERLTAEGDEEKIQEFIDANVSDMTTVVDNMAVVFRKRYLGLA